MTQEILDQFTGPDGTSVTTYSAAWARHSAGTGLMALLGNRARQSGSTTSLHVYVGTQPSSADYDVSANLYFGTVSGAPSVGLCGRIVSTDVATMYQARATIGTGIALLRIINNSATTLATVPYTPVQGSEPRLTLRMRGDQISVLLDGAVVIGPITDANIAGAGYAGMRAASSNTTSVHLDNFSVDTADAASSTTTVSPDAAALVVTGYAPSIAQTANQAVSPAPAALVVTGYAPTVSQTSASAISPAPAALVVQGYAPTISQTQRTEVSPAAGGLVVKGWAPTITQTGTQPLPEVTPAPGGGGGGGGSIREVRAFAEELDRARKPTKAEKKRRRQAIETAVLELLPNEPVAARAAPVIAQLVARTLPPATWAPIYGPRPVVVLPPAVVDDVHARVAEWLAEQEHQALLAELEDDFEVELLLLG